MDTRGFKKRIAIPFLAGVMALSGCGNTQGSTNVPVEQTTTNETDTTQKETSKGNNVVFTFLDKDNLPDGTKQKDMLKNSIGNELRVLDL